MINKYAEIRDRITLYNACKGILRVKMAFNWASIANTAVNWGGKAMNAANAAGKALKPVGDAMNTAGKAVGTAFGTAGKAIGKGLDYLGDPTVTQRLSNVQNAAATIGTVANAGQSAIGAMGAIKQMGTNDGQLALDDRRTQLENARLDMVEQQLNAQRNAMGLPSVGAESEAGDDGDADASGQAA